MDDLILLIKRELYGSVCVKMSEAYWLTDEEQVDEEYEKTKAQFAKWLVEEFYSKTSRQNCAESGAEKS